MRKKLKGILALLLTLSVAGLYFVSCDHHTQKESGQREQVIEDTLRAQVDTFYQFITDTLQPAALQKRSHPKRLQQLFLKARLLYKKFEWAAEYFMGATTLLVNGPPVQEVENADLLDPYYMYALDPSGLQVIEEILFPKYDTANQKRLVQQLELLQRNTGYYKDFFKDHSISDWRILDGMKLEVFRILTLGISGFDNPLTLHSMEESAASLESLKKALLHYSKTKADSGLIVKMDLAIHYLKKHQDFDAFNRAAFITNYGNPISAAITDIQYRTKSFEIRYNRLLRQEARTLFDTAAFNVDAFVPGRKYDMTPEKVELGKRLFFDPSLSATGARSCASCHQPDKAFTDGLMKNKNIHGHTLIDRNTPTLINAALQSNQFYDMRALTLEDQARDVIENKAEMDGSLQKIVGKISRDKAYRKLFKTAFPNVKESGIDSSEILNALAAYVRSLTRLNSRFDEYMRGDTAALSLEEVKGFNLFMGKGKCATCHFMPLFNGVTPPKFVESEAEVIGVPESVENPTLDPDLGWYNVVRIPSFKHAFKTPTVRNVSKTAPYMHNGVYTSLEEVMDFYNNGGGAGLGFNISNQTLSEDSLHLTNGETRAIIAFMKSLESR